MSGKRLRGNLSLLPLEAMPGVAQIHVEPGSGLLDVRPLPEPQRHYYSMGKTPSSMREGDGATRWGSTHSLEWSHGGI